MKYKFTIDGKEFTSKKSVTDYVRAEILYKYADLVRISEEHLRFMVSLLQYHPWGEQKIGPGVVDMWIAKNPNFPTRGFYLSRTDGTTTDFSFLQCVQTGSVVRDLREACRAAIVPTVLAVKNAAFDAGQVVCPIKQRVVTKTDCHVDHEPPNTFAAIFAAYLETGIKPDSIALKHDDNDAGTKFSSEQDATAWVSFHNQIAKLRVISKEANLSDVRKSV